MRPTFSDLLRDGLIDPGIGSLTGVELLTARWQMRQGRDIRSVRSRAAAFPSARNFRTPDVVDVVARITFEYTCTTSVKAIRRRVRQERAQSPNLVLVLMMPESPWANDVHASLVAASRYRHDYDSMTLLWQRPSGILIEVPWPS